MSGRRGVNPVTGLCSCGEPPLFDAELEVIERRLGEGATFRRIGAELDRDPKTGRDNAIRRGWQSARARNVQ